MTEKLITTGQAAKICSVTPDTVLKWIRSGRLKASRTPGGHHRVSLENLSEIFKSKEDHLAQEDPKPAGSQKRIHPFRYCWEFNNEDGTLNGCKDCIVYTMRAKRCYEVVDRAREIGHNKLFCKQSCESCDYYQAVHRQSANVLLITDNEILAGNLRTGADAIGLNFAVTSCEYTTSALVDTFRPDYAIVDCRLGEQLTKDICDHLVADPRIPYVRVVLAATDEEIPKECDRDVFARMEKPFNISDVAECIHEDWEENAI